MKKKTWAIVLSAVLVLALAVTGTFAWLTDRDSDVNVFTWGNVDITLNEEFEQGATLIPGKDIEKDVTVSNVGKSDAWVWVKIAMPAILDSDDASKNVIHFNYAAESVADGLWNWKQNGTWNVAKNVPIDGKAYNVYTVLYDSILAPGATTAYSAMTKVYLDTAVDIDPNGNLYKVVGGNAAAVGWNIDSDGLPVVYISAYATQAEGFATAAEAYAAYQTQWGNAGEPEMASPVTVADVNELDAALNAGETMIVLEDGEYTMPASGINKTFTLVGTEDAVMNINAAGGENCNYNLQGADVTFNGITIAGNGGWARSKTTFINCTFTGAFEMQSTPVLFENCTFNLNNSYIWTLSVSEATFNDCVFNTNGKALLVYSHGATDCVVNINNCEFNASAAAYTGTGKHVAAVSIDATNAKSITVNFTGTNTAQTGTDAFAGLCQIKGGAGKITVNGADAPLA